MTTTAKVTTPLVAALVAMALTSGFAPVADAGTTTVTAVTMAARPPAPSPPPTTTTITSTTTTSPVPAPATRGPRGLSTARKQDMLRAVTDQIRAIAGKPYGDRLGSLSVEVDRLRVIVYWKGRRPAAMNRLEGTHHGVTVVLHRAKVSEGQMEWAMGRLAGLRLKERAVDGSALAVCEAGATTDASGVFAGICYAGGGRTGRPELPDSNWRSLRKRIPGVPLVRVVAQEQSRWFDGEIFSGRTWQGQGWPGQAGLWARPAHRNAF